MREGGKFKNNGYCTETVISTTRPEPKIKCTGVSSDGGTWPKAWEWLGIGLSKEGDERQGLIRDFPIKCWGDRGVWWKWKFLKIYGFFAWIYQCFSVESVDLQINSYSQIKHEISNPIIEEMLKPQDNQEFNGNPFFFTLILTWPLVIAFFSTVSPLFLPGFVFVCSGTKKGKPASCVPVACYSLGVCPVHTGKRWIELQLVLRTAGERKFQGTLAHSSSYVCLPVDLRACTVYVGACRSQANIFRDLSQYYSPQRPPGCYCESP